MDESPGGYGAIGALEKAKETEAKPAKVGVRQNLYILWLSYDYLMIILWLSYVEWCVNEYLIM